MKKTKSVFAVYAPIFFLMTAVATALRALACLYDLDILSGYFNDKSFINAATAVLVSGAVLLFTYAVTAPRGRKLRASFSTALTYVPAGIISAALVFFAANSFFEVKLSALSISQIISSKNFTLLSAILLGIFALLACVYFVLNAMVTEHHSVARAGFGITAVIFFALYAAFLYFDTALPLNSPNKIVDQMAYLFVAVFILYEIRISLGRECWNLYVAFGFVAAMLCVYSSIPTLIIYFVKNRVISDSIFESILTFCVGIFIICRIILSHTLYEDRDNDIVTLIKQSFGERGAYLREKHEIERRAYLEVANRLSEVSEAERDIPESTVFEGGESEQMSIFETTDTDSAAYGYSNEQMSIFEGAKTAVLPEDTEIIGEAENDSEEQAPDEADEAQIAIEIEGTENATQITIDTEIAADEAQTAAEAEEADGGEQAAAKSEAQAEEKPEQTVGEETDGAQTEDTDNDVTAAAEDKDGI